MDRFYPNFVPHKNSLYFGRVDVTFVVKTAAGVKFPIKLRGLTVKSIKGKPHVGMFSTEGTDANGNGTGEWYDQFMPRSAAGRMVWTAFIFADPEIQEFIASTARATEAAAAEAAADAAAAAHADEDEEGAGEAPDFGENNPFSRNQAA